MPKAHPKKFSKPESSDSELSEGDDSSTVYTSFDSRESPPRARGAPKKGAAAQKKPQSSVKNVRKSYLQPGPSQRRSESRSPRKSATGPGTSKPAANSNVPKKHKPTTPTKKTGKNESNVKSSRDSNVYPGPSGIQKPKKGGKKKWTSKHATAQNRDISAGPSRGHMQTSDNEEEYQSDSDLPQRVAPSGKLIPARSHVVEERARNPRKRKPMSIGMKALKEIKYYQRTTDLLMRKLPFARVVREISNQYRGGLRWQVHAIMALQEAAEVYLVHLFEDSLLLTLHRSRVTLSVKDMQLARRIQSRFDHF